MLRVFPAPTEMDNEAIKAEQREERVLSSDIFALNHGAQAGGRKSGAQSTLDEISANSAVERERRLSEAKAEKDQMMAKLGSIAGGAAGAPGSAGAGGGSQTK